jgi:hypothetical protein
MALTRQSFFARVHSLPYLADINVKNLYLAKKHKYTEQGQ